MIENPAVNPETNPVFVFNDADVPTMLQGEVLNGTAVEDNTELDPTQIEVIPFMLGRGLIIIEAEPVCNCVHFFGLLSSTLFREYENVPAVLVGTDNFTLFPELDLIVWSAPPLIEYVKV